MEDKDFSYRNLIVWQKSMQFTKVVYSLVKLIPEIEKYALLDSD